MNSDCALSTLNKLSSLIQLLPPEPRLRLINLPYIFITGYFAARQHHRYKQRRRLITSTASDSSLSRTTSLRGDPFTLTSSNIFSLVSVPTPSQRHHPLYHETLIRYPIPSSLHPVPLRRHSPQQQRFTYVQDM